MIMEKLKQNWLLIVVGVLLIVASLFYIFKDDVTPVKAVSRWRTIENTKKIDSLNRELKKVSERVASKDLLIEELTKKYNTGKKTLVSKKEIKEIVSIDTAKVKLNDCLSQIEICDSLIVETKKVVVQRDTVIHILTAKTGVLSNEIDNQRSLVKDVEKSLRKERTKKVIWQTIAVSAVASASYLLISN
jgi:hypothetical protein